MGSRERIPLVLCVVFLVIAVIGCTLWTKWQNRPLLGNTDEEICETIARTEKVKKATIDLKQVKDGEIDGHTYRCALYVTEDDTKDVYKRQLWDFLFYIL